MKITIVENDQSEQKEINLQDLEPGTVFEFVGGAIGLAILNVDADQNEAVLLIHGGGGDTWFKLALGFKHAIIEKVIGKLTGITVEEYEQK